MSKLDAALAGIPAEQKSAYLEAKQRIPEIVERESSEDSFLNATDGNEVKAARRLVAYWNQRKSLFKDRAYLPMIQTGTGALTEEDIEILNTGAVARLPNDLDGRPVFYFDRDQLTREQLPLNDSRSRCFFYLLTVSCTNAVAQKKGIVVLASMSNRSGHPSEDTKFGSLCVEFGSIMPTRIHRIHLLSITESSVLGIALDALFAFAIRLLGKRVGQSTEIHRGASKAVTFAKLKSHRLPKKAIPQEFGGGWSHDKYKQWERKQLKLESEIYLTEEERLDRKRKINVLHSRQKRVRRKIEFEVLEGRAGAIATLNESLKDMNGKLELLLAAAKQQVAIHEQTVAANNSFVTRLSMMPHPSSMAERTNPTSMMNMQGIGHPSLLGQADLTLFNAYGGAQDMLGAGHVGTMHHSYASAGSYPGLAMGSSMADPNVLHSAMLQQQAARMQHSSTTSMDYLMQLAQNQPQATAMQQEASLQQYYGVSNPSWGYESPYYGAPSPYDEYESKHHAR